MNNSYQARLQKGSTPFTILIMVILGGTGYYLSIYMIQWSGTVQFIRMVSFLSAVMVLLLTPVYALHKQLSEIKHRIELTETEKERVRGIVRNKTLYYIKVCVFSCLSAVYMISSKAWPVDSELSILLSRIAVGLLFIGLSFFVQTLMGIQEVESFNTLLERRAQRAQEKNRLLKKMTENHAESGE